MKCWNDDDSIDDRDKGLIAGPNLGPVESRLRIDSSFVLNRFDLQAALQAIYLGCCVSKFVHKANSKFLSRDHVEEVQNN